jgi:sugar lactone lactonase YvrE
MIQEPLVVGLGSRLYEIERPWALDQAMIEPGRPAEIAIDSADLVYSYNRFDRYTDPAGLPTVTVYAPDGKLVRSLELPEVADAHGITIGPDDEILLVDRDRHEIRILNNDGTLKLTLGERNRPGRPFSHPTLARVGPGGDIFVTDGYGNSHVHRFSSKGDLIRTWGVPGTGPGEFSTPHGVDFTASGEVIVCDRENNRIQFFDVNGKFIREVGDLFHPMDVLVDSEGMILVTDQIPRLSMFAPDGKLVGRCRPCLYGGHGMAVDSTGNLYFTEVRVNRLTRLRRLS